MPGIVLQIIGGTTDNGYIINRAMDFIELTDPKRRRPTTSNPTVTFEILDHKIPNRNTSREVFACLQNSS